MSNAVIGALHAILGLDSTNFETGLKAVPAKMKGVAAQIEAIGEEMALGFERSLEVMKEDFDEKIAEMASEVPVLGKAMSAFGVAGLVAAAALGAFSEGMEQAHKSMEWANDLQKAADRIGVTTEYLQQMQFAGKATGVGLDAVRQSLQNLNGALGAYQSGVGDAKLKKVFEDLGITREAVAHMQDASQLIPVLADRLKDLGSQAERVHMADKLGIEPLLPVLARGSEGVAKLREEASALGIVLDNETNKTLSEMNEKVERASAQIDINLKKAFADLSPVVVGASQAMADFTHHLDNSIAGTKLLLATAGKGGISEYFKLWGEGAKKGLSGDDLQNYMLKGFVEFNAKVNGKPEETGTDSKATPDQVALELLQRQLTAVQDAIRPRSETIFTAMKAQIDTLNAALAKHLIDQKTYAQDVAEVHKKAAEEIRRSAPKTDPAMTKLKADLKAVQEAIVPPAETVFAKLTAEVRTLDAALKDGLIDQKAYLADMSEAHAKAAAAVLKGVSTPDELATEEYRKRVAELDEALKLNIITLKQWSEAMAVAIDKRNEADKIGPIKKIDLGKSGVPEIKPFELPPEWKTAAEEAARAWRDAFTEIKDIGKQALDDIIERGRVDWKRLLIEIIDHWEQVVLVIKSVWQAAQNSKGGGISGLINAAVAAAGHNANGTESWPGGLSWVGERGPELVNLPRGVSVSSHESILSALSTRQEGFGVVKVEVDTTPYFDIKVRQAAAPMVQHAAIEGAAGGSQMAQSTIADYQSRQIP